MSNVIDATSRFLDARSRVSEKTLRELNATADELNLAWMAPAAVRFGRAGVIAVENVDEAVRRRAK